MRRVQVELQRLSMAQSSYTFQVRSAMLQRVEEVVTDSKHNASTSSFVKYPEPRMIGEEEEEPCTRF